MRRKSGLCLAALCLAFGTSVAASPSYGAERTLRCSQKAGFVDGPFASAKETAEAIFRAVVSTGFPDMLSRYPVIEAYDEHDHWVVYQVEPPIPQEPGRVVVQMGGGGLSMNINKCTGAVSGVYYMR